MNGEEEEDEEEDKKGRKGNCSMTIIAIIK